MRKYKKIFALLMAIMMCCSLHVPAGATEQESQGNVVSRFYYTVYDKDGNVKETGIMPNPNERYSWSGITLNNGEEVELKRDDRYYFYALNNTRVDFEVTLNRVANIYIAFVNNSGNYFEDFRGNQMTSCSFTLENNTSFYVMVMNVSSDPITINSATLTF